MATIFEKLPASGERCLVLESKEALFYPFNFGTGWKDIRLGMLFSFTSQSDLNGLYTTQSIMAASPSNNIYVGFIKSPDDELPLTPNAIYAGMAGFTGETATVTLTATNSISVSSSASVNSLISSGLLRRPTVSSSVNLLHSSTAAIATGSGNFVGAFQVALQINHILKTYRVLQSYSGPLDGFPSSNTSTTALRAGMAGYSFAGEIQTITGYWTTDFTSATDMLPLPDKALVYSPFLQARMRIHNLVVEKYG